MQIAYLRRLPKQQTGSRNISSSSSMLVDLHRTQWERWLVMRTPTPTGSVDMCAANMSAAHRHEFERRAMRYRHILQVQSGFQRMARKYQSDRASGAWWASPPGGPRLPTTAATTTTGSPQSAPATAGTVVPASAAQPGPSSVTAAGQSSGLGSTPTQSTSAGTQTAAAPPIDPAAFQALERKMDKFMRKVDKLSQDVAYIKKWVRCIRRTLPRANL
ncbi:uncharacterized protein [Pleurodeles waltl]|uniref:uncharacterized protein n=1 Tax=Pleurodeles waltl TaxID=8319 RepID=UPI0037093FDB